MLCSCWFDFCNHFTTISLVKLFEFYATPSLSIFISGLRFLQHLSLSHVLSCSVFLAIDLPRIGRLIKASTIVLFSWWSVATTPFPYKTILKSVRNSKGCFFALTSSIMLISYASHLVTFLYCELLWDLFGALSVGPHGDGSMGQWEGCFSR